MINCTQTPPFASLDNYFSWNHSGSWCASCQCEVLFLRWSVHSQKWIASWCILLVVEVKAFQWNVRPRWGRNFWKSVRCCVQLVFIMLVFSPIDGLSWVFHGYHVDGCSYSLVFWEFCTSLVARSVVQDSYKHRRMLGRCYNKCLWGKARMGSAYHFNLLMYFLASHRHTTLTCHIFLGLPTILPKMKVVAIVYLFAKLASLCLPSVSPLSPLLAFVSSSLSLLLPAAAAWLGFLFCSTAESSWV